jgi:hypothetical protein
MAVKKRQLFLLLDLFPNAAVAYSLRKLRTAYSGSAIRVRRSSDNTEQDIGFDSSGNLDVNIIETFVGWNLWSYSEEMQQSVWTKTRTTVTGDTVVAPDGNTTGDILFETTESGTHSISRAQAVTIGEDYSISFYIKDEGRRYFQIRSAVNLSTNNANLPTAMLDLTTGTVISDNGLFRVAPIITAVGGGWYKVEYGLIANSTTTSTTLQLNLSPDGTQTNYIGDITKGMAIWGIQITKSSLTLPYRQTLAIAEGNGFVTTWYDQSGNGNNATQATAGNQPRIINGGVIEVVGSLPSILTNSTLLDTVININTLNTSMFVVNKKNSGSLELNVSMSQDGVFSRYSAIRKSSADTNSIRFRDSSNNDVIFNSSNTSLALTLNSFFTIADNERVIRTNGVEFSTNTDGITFVANRLFINRFRNSSTQNIGNGYFSEIIIYANNKYNDRTGIESNINTHYNIY